MLADANLQLAHTKSVHEVPPGQLGAFQPSVMWLSSRIQLGLLPQRSSDPFAHSGIIAKPSLRLPTYAISHIRRPGVRDQEEGRWEQFPAELEQVVP